MPADVLAVPDDRKFTCAQCGIDFEVTDEDNWTQEDAEKECEEMFGVADPKSHPGMAVVCDDCWKELVPQA